MFKLEDINTLEDLKQAKAQAYGNKGEIFELQNQLKTSPIELKKELGQKINLLKKQYEDFFEQADLRIKEIQINNKINSEFIDISEPVNKQGSIHPITIVEERLKEWFIQHGYYQRQEGK